MAKLCRDATKSTPEAITVAWSLSFWYQERLECTIFKWVASPTFFIGGKPERAQHRRYKWEILCMYFYYHTIVTRVPAWSHEVCRASNITNRVHDFRDCKRITRTLYFVTRSIWGFQHRIHIHGFMSAAKTLATRLLNRGCSQTTIKHLMHKCNYRHVQVIFLPNQLPCGCAVDCSTVKQAR